MMNIDFDDGNCARTTTTSTSTKRSCHLRQWLHLTHLFKSISFIFSLFSSFTFTVRLESNKKIDKIRMMMYISMGKIKTIDINSISNDSISSLNETLWMGPFSSTIRYWHELWINLNIDSSIAVNFVCGEMVKLCNWDIL